MVTLSLSKHDRATVSTDITAVDLLITLVSAQCTSTAESIWEQTGSGSATVALWLYKLVTSRTSHRRAGVEERLSCSHTDLGFRGHSFAEFGEFDDCLTAHERMIIAEMTVNRLALKNECGDEALKNE